MDALREQIGNLRASFARLSQREQLLVIVAGAAVALFVFFLVGMSVSSAINTAEKRVKAKTDQLAQVLQLQGEYKARERDREARLRELGRSNLRLVSVVEDVARQAGVEIGQLKPEEGEPNAEGIVESRVDLRASNLSADRMAKFLELVENTKGLVIVRRLKIDRPYRRDTVDVEMTITTYKLKQG